MTQQNNGGPILTDWFPPDVKPVRAGVYEIDRGMKRDCYSYWNGEAWGHPAFEYGDDPNAIERAAAPGWKNDMDHTLNMGLYRFRGLAEKPE
jgi:hypothetical protein